MKNRTDKSMLDAFQSVYEELKAANCSPKLHVLDNECSQAIKKFVQSKKSEIQLVEPHNHRVNAVEPAVKTAKYHLLAALATIDPSYPLQVWDAFLQQVQETLNLLRTSQRNNKISAYKDMAGPFDYNKTPMAPLGTKGLAFVDPGNRARWQMHANDVFCVGRKPQHY